jgi:hypothetical protein
VRVSDWEARVEFLAELAQLEIRDMARAARAHINRSCAQLIRWQRARLA